MFDPMTFQRAAKWLHEIRQEASEAGIDLTAAEHSLWLPNGEQFLFRVASANVADLYANVAHYCLKRAVIYHHRTGHITEIDTYSAFARSSATANQLDWE